MAAAGSPRNRASRSAAVGPAAPSARSRAALGQPAFAVRRRLGLGEPGVRLVGGRRLLLDTGAVAQRDLVDGVRAPLGASHVLAAAGSQNDTAFLSGPENHVIRPGGTVHE